MALEGKQVGGIFVPYFPLFSIGGAVRSTNDQKVARGFLMGFRCGRIDIIEHKSPLS